MHWISNGCGGYTAVLSSLGQKLSTCVEKGHQLIPADQRLRENMEGDYRPINMRTVAWDVGFNLVEENKDKKLYKNGFLFNIIGCVCWMRRRVGVRPLPREKKKGKGTDDEGTLKYFKQSPYMLTQSHFICTKQSRFNPSRSRNPGQGKEPHAALTS